MSDPGKAVFLSYASQDAEAAKRICDALRAAGVEVWFDQSELVGGDAWDQKIRRQIKECALLIPIISAATQARTEGYFRLEWRLADQRTHLMGRNKAFLLPVTIDGTTDADADVPESFVAVQWTKAPGGEVPAGFAARVKTLLDVNVGASLLSRHSPATADDDARGRAQGAPLQVKAGSGDPALQKSPRWLAPVIAGAVVAVLALILARPWEKASPPAGPSARRSAPTTTVTTGVPSEARQLVAKAWEQMNKPEMARAELEVADELCKRAVALDGDDADAWAAWSQVDSWYIYHNLDRSAARQEGARTKAARALKLSPNSYEARLAQACHLVRQGGGQWASLFAKEADGLLRALLRERPDEPRALLSFGVLLRNIGKISEAREVFGRMAKNPSFAAQAMNELGWAEYFNNEYRASEAAADASVALQPYWGNLILKTRLAQKWQGDLIIAEDALHRLPVSVQQEDWGASYAAELYYLRREPEAMLRVLNNVPRDWLQSNSFDGPKAYYAALAQQMAGHEEAAQIQWRKALNLIERRLTDQPDSGALLHWKGNILAAMGKRLEAETILHLARDMGEKNRPLRDTDAIDEILLGNLDAAITLLERAVTERSRWATAATYRLDPSLDPLRDQPRFKALLAQIEADPRFSPRAEAASAPSASSQLPSPSSPPQADSKSVAVLAFANLSDDKANEYFSDGISEELLNVLAKVPGLKVMARTSSFHFKGKDTPIADIAAQLGVAYVVEGSVRKQGDKVRITAQLIKAADGFHVWSDTFTRDLKDIFAVQDEIAGLIAQQLQLKLGESTRVTKVVNPEAYRLLLEGRQFWNLRTEEGFTKAEAAFTKALALDPQFAEAHAGLAGVCVIRSVYRELDAVALDANDLRRAVNEGRRALEIDPASAEAHVVLGYAQMLGNQLAEADRHFQQALMLSPNSALVHCWYGLLLSNQGRLDASTRHYQQAAELDPLWFINLQMLGGSLALAQRYDQSLGIIERAAALRTEIFLPNAGERARTLLELGRKEEAFEAARYILRHPDVSPRWNSDAVAIRVLWQGERRQEAEDESTRLFARWPHDSYLRGFTLVALGRFDEALAFLEHTPSTIARNLFWDTMWDPWREDPRFTQLVVKLGRAEEYKVGRETLARMRKEQEAKK